MTIENFWKSNYKGVIIKINETKHNLPKVLQWYHDTIFLVILIFFVKKIRA